MKFSRSGGYYTIVPKNTSPLDIGDGETPTFKFDITEPIVFIGKD